MILRVCTWDGIGWDGVWYGSDLARKSGHRQGPDLWVSMSCDLKKFYPDLYDSNSGKQAYLLTRCSNAEVRDKGTVPQLVAYCYWFNQHKLIIFQSWRPEFPKARAGLKSRSWQFWVPDRGSRGDSISMASPPSRGCTHSCALPASNFVTLLPLLPHPHLLLSLTLQPPSLTLKATYDHTNPAQIVAGKFLSQNSCLHLQSPSCQVRQHTDKFWGLGFGHLSGPLFCLT